MDDAANNEADFEVIPHNDTVLLGDTWVFELATWTVVSARDGIYGLSGPGPCRSMDYKSRDAVLKGNLIARQGARKDPRFRHTIVVFSDDETYDTLENVRTVDITDAELKAIQEGDKVRHVIDLDARSKKLKV